MKTPIHDRLNKIARKGACNDVYKSEYARDAGIFQEYAIKGLQWRNPYSDIRINPKYWIIGLIERQVGNGFLALDYAKSLFDRCMEDDVSALSEVWAMRR